MQGPQARPSVRIQVLFGQALWLPGSRPAASFFPEVETWPEDLESFSVVLAPSDHRPHDCGERMPGDAEPIGPGSVLT